MFGIADYFHAAGFGCGRSIGVQLYGHRAFGDEFNGFGQGEVFAAVAIGDHGVAQVLQRLLGCIAQSGHALRFGGAAVNGAGVFAAVAGGEYDNSHARSFCLLSQPERAATGLIMLICLCLKRMPRTTRR